MRQFLALAAALVVVPISRGDAESTRPMPAALVVSPSTVTLDSADSVQRLLVTGAARESSAGRVYDFSREVTYASSDPRVVTVTADGVVAPKGDGRAEIRVVLGGTSATVPVVVKGYAVEPPVSFRNQVLPILTKAGCNTGGCHGKASGQNGFKLSLLGSIPGADFDSIVREGRGRRVFHAAPDRSLLLTKATAAVAHGGGRRFNVDSAEARLISRWIRHGTLPGSADDPAVVKIEVQPKEAIADTSAEQQILVTATYSDGRRRDVTAEAQFKSSEPDVAGVDNGGLVRTKSNAGKTAIMARYMGKVAVCGISIPLPPLGQSASHPTVPRHNFIDEHVQANWAKLNLTPSPIADDATFLRRAYLDAIGTLPTPAEVRAFLADKSPDKRAKAIDAILDRPDYADFWAVKWGDLLRNQRKGQRELQRGTYTFHAWIRNAFATNMPYDRFVRAIVAAQGTVDQHAPVIWYRTVRNRTSQTNDTAQLFLGMRIQCAQCHNHPYEKWTQDDYYAFQAFFARMGQKSGETAQEPAIFVRPDGAVRNPSTGKVMAPRGLDGPSLTISEDEDPRQSLVDWMARPENPFFARALANRLWGHFLGRGLVDPLDDIRVTNPPSNPELLDALARDFIDHKFDVKHLIRTIMNSSTYQLSSDPTPGNTQDRQNYARAYPKRLQAEVMLDAICATTGAVETFNGLPAGTRTIQLPDEAIQSYFLDVFGRPERETACECERPREANLAQALQLLNSSDLQRKIGTPKGRLTSLIAAKKTDAEIVDELYFAALGRPPRPSEIESLTRYIAAHKDRKAALEDIIWAVLNTKEFLFNH
jgi:Protein of unknown function (DUF1553)/Protein of unknown function (DUF1549)